jgi:hypothetical protein
MRRAHPLQVVVRDEARQAYPYDAATTFTGALYHETKDSSKWIKYALG